MQYLAYFSMLYGTHSIPAVITIRPWLPFRNWRATRAAHQWGRRHKLTLTHLKPIS